MGFRLTPNLWFLLVHSNCVAVFISMSFLDFQESSYWVDVLIHGYPDPLASISPPLVNDALFLPYFP